MRTATEEAIRAHELGQTRTVFRVLVLREDDVWIDLRDIFDRDYLLSAEVTTHVDQQAPSAIVRARARTGNVSLSPLSSSRANLLGDGNTISALITKGREIRVEALTLAQHRSIEPTELEWAEGLIFHGRVDTVSFGTDPIEIAARDFLTAIAQDTWIESDNGQLNGVPADGDSTLVMGSPSGVLIGTAMNAVTARHVPSYSSLLTVYEPPTASSFVFLQWFPGVGPVMDELQRMADQIGWTIMSEFRESTNEFQLTLRNPTRTKTTPDLTYTSDVQVRAYEDLSDDITNIRNVVSIIFRDSSQSSDSHLVKGYATASNIASITSYGRRWMQVQEESTSNIDTQAEADAMAEAILSDLAQSAIAARMVISYDVRPTLHDLCRFTADGDRFADDLDLFVLGFSHAFNDSGDAVTTLHLQAAPASGVQRHLDDKFARPGGPKITTALRPLSGSPTFGPRPGGGEVTADFADHPRLFGRIRDFEIHESGTSVFTASEATRTYRSRANGARLSGNPGETSYFRIMPISEDGFRTDENTGTFSGVFGYAGPHLLNPSIDLGRLTDYGFDVTSRFETLVHPTAWPPDNWNMRTGTWDVDAELSGTRLSGDYSLLQRNCEMFSRLIPVRELTPYRYDFLYQFHYGSTDTTHQLAWDIEWYDSSAAGATLIATSSDSEIPFDGSLTEDTWYRRSLRDTAPVGARFARITMASSGDADGYNLVDRTELSAFPESFFAYLDADDDFAVDTWHQIRCASEIFDYGSMYDATGDFRAEIRLPGLYEFSVGARIDASPQINFMALRLERNAVIIAEQMVDCLAADEALGYANLMLASGPVNMDEGDEVTAYVYANLASAGTPNLLSGTGVSWMRGQRIL